MRKTVKGSPFSIERKIENPLVWSELKSEHLDGHRLVCLAIKGSEDTRHSSLTPVIIEDVAVVNDPRSRGAWEGVTHRSPQARPYLALPPRTSTPNGDVDKC